MMKEKSLGFPKDPEKGYDHHHGNMRWEFE